MSHIFKYENRLDRFHMYQKKINNNKKIVICSINIVSYAYIIMNKIQTNIVINNINVYI